MAFDRPDPRLLAFPIVAAALFADDADACPTLPYETYGSTTDFLDCNDYDSLAALNGFNAEAIPIDGVLVLQAPHTGAWGQPVLDHADIAVTKDGEPVAGSIEPSELSDWAVWRPQSAWTPGLHQFTATITNSELPAECGALEIPVSFEFTIEAAPAVALTAPTLVGEQTHEVTPYASLATLACCPGVAPSEFQAGCSGTYVDYDPAQCAPTHATGRLGVVVTGTPAATGPTGGQLYHTLTIGPETINIVFADIQYGHTDFNGPFCASLTTHDFRDGSTLAGPEVCFGEDIASEIGGPFPIDVPDTFACALQTCTPDNGTWDLEMCAAYEPGSNAPTTGNDTLDTNGNSGTTGDPGEDDTGKDGCGGGCNTGPTGGLLALLALRRRRRYGPSNGCKELHTVSATITCPAAVGWIPSP